jgi:hypothetical protein
VPDGGADGRSVSASGSVGTPELTDAEIESGIVRAMLEGRGVVAEQLAEMLKERKRAPSEARRLRVVK